VAFVSSASLGFDAKFSQGVDRQIPSIAELNTPGARNTISSDEVAQKSQEFLNAAARAIGV
jgi:hypothetical protein